MTGAFSRKFNPRTLVLHEYFFRLRHGSASPPQFEARARAHGGLSASDLDALATSISTSIDPQAVGWWLLTVLVALIGILALAQALARQAAVEADDYPTLSALGASRRQLFALTMARTLVFALAGAVGGVALASLSSFFTPVGEARLADPTPGFSFDAHVLIPAGLAAVAVVLALGLWPAIKWSRPLIHDDRPVTHPSRAVSALSASGASASALIGVRHALERGRGRTAMPVSSALIGSILAVAVACWPGTARRGPARRYARSNHSLADAGTFLVRTEPGVKGEAALTQLSRAYPNQVNIPRPPTDLVNFGEAVNFPLIFGVVAVLFGTATLLHLLLTTLRRRRREMGLLKSLGMLRRQVAYTVTWQTTTVAVIGIVIGVPIGVAVGRLVWHAFATNLGVFAGPVTTAWVIATVAAATLVAANLLAVVPAIIAAALPGRDVAQGRVSARRP